jgi:ribose-phosphate pyrophosphokinase
MKPLVFAFPDDVDIARKMAAELGAGEGAVDWHRFPDRESLMTLRGECAGRDVIFVCTLTDPDSKALPLHFCAATARDLGARKVGLVAPYLGYMRQDQQFSPGQSRSARDFARFLSGSFDWLVTADPHLHRIEKLGEVFSIPAIAASSMPAVTDWIKRSVPDPVIIGPDRESAQWAQRVAQSLDVPWTALEKIRSGDRDVKVSAPDPQIIRNRNPVIIDDIVSSGRTLAETLIALRAQGAPEVTCVIVHALFAAGAEAALRSAGARRIVSSNTVAHSTNAIDVAPLLVAAMTPLLSSN